MVFDIFYEEWNSKRVKAIIQYYSVPFFANKRILDLGSGRGELANSLSRLGADVLCVDARKSNLDFITKNNSHLKTLQADLDNEWPFSGQRFDMVLSLGLLCHLDNYDKHIKDICGVAEHIVLETEVLDTTDINWKLKYYEDKVENDLSASGKACVVSAANIQNHLSNLGATYKRKDDAILNCDKGNYSWKETNSGKNVVYSY
jgi:2-polyprenyl-3-methyl-5-hydroxy-6-metoxy-1,4-benzoquinol methylase